MNVKAAVLPLFFGCLLGADDDAPRRRVRLGGITVGAGYAHGAPGWGPVGYYPYRTWAPWGLYDPFFYSPFIHPALYGAYPGGAPQGEVRIDTASPDASVYIDGAYAGPASKLRSLQLAPGAYDLEVRHAAGGVYAKRIYVLSGKTLRLHATFDTAAGARP